MGDRSLVTAPHTINRTSKIIMASGPMSFDKRRQQAKRCAACKNSRPFRQRAIGFLKQGIGIYAAK
jgi:hypothetical protein